MHVKNLKERTRYDTPKMSIFLGLLVPNKVVNIKISYKIVFRLVRL